MEWKLSEAALKAKEAIKNDEELVDGFGGSDGFWYDITDGGYFDPEKALADKEQIQKVKEAVDLLKSLEENVYQLIVPEF